MDRHRCPAPPTDGSTGAVQAECGACSAGTSEHGSGTGTASTSWPHVSALELGALPTAAGCARTRAKLVLAEWGLSHLVADAQILVSELVTNALRASWSLEGNPPIVLRLLADDHRLIIEAWNRCVSFKVVWCELELRLETPSVRWLGDQEAKGQTDASWSDYRDVGQIMRSGCRRRSDGRPGPVVRFPTCDHCRGYVTPNSRQR